MEKLHIDEVYPKSPNNNNYIVNFQNAYLNGEFKSKKCTLYEDSKSHDKTILCDIANLSYAGTEQKSDLTKTLLLARNKLTGKVKLIEVSTVDMKPLLITPNDVNETLDVSYIELSKKFGSKKHKKKVEQREKFQVNKQSLSEQMHNVTVNIAEDKLDLSTYLKTDSDDFYVPPIERMAKKVEDVYDIYKILTQEQYDKIYSELESKDYISDIVPWMKELVTKNMRKEYTVLAVYASCLFQFHSTMTKDVVKKTFVVCQHSPTLNEIILKNFTTMINNRRNRSLQFKDKALCHGVVFLLLINNFKFNADELSKHVKVSFKTFSTKVRVTGASVVTSGDNKFIQLKIPLATTGFARRRNTKF